MIDRTTIYGLVVQCPLGEECKDCPLQEIRKLQDFAKRVEMIDAMNLEEINELLLFHNQHRFERERDYFNTKLGKKD